MASSPMYVDMSSEFPVEQFGTLKIDSEMKASKELPSSNSKTSSEVGKPSRSQTNVALSSDEVVPCSSRQSEAEGLSSSSGPLDPVSTDETIGNSGIASFKSARKNKKRKRTDDDRCDEEAATLCNDTQVPALPVALTPYRALEKLYGGDFLIKLRCGAKQGGKVGDTHLWQCIIACGDLIIKADSSRKDVAKEVASNEFLSHLAPIHPECLIPEYILPDELFIDTQVIKEDLKKILKGAKVDCKLDLKQVDEFGAKRCRRTFFTYCYTFSAGAEKFEGEHVIASYARAVAMKNMYLKFMEKEPTPVPHFTGEHCHSSQLYDFLETQIFRNGNPHSSSNVGNSNSHGI